MTSTKTTTIAGAGLFALTVAALSATGAGAASAAAQGAYSDAYVGTQGTTLSVGAADGVLANDFCDVGVASVGGFSNFVNGELDLHADGSFDYMPDPAYAGPRTFDYDLLCDGVAVGTATANLVFSPLVPVGAADFYTTPQDTTLTIAPNGVLANDTGALAVIDAKDLPAGLVAQLDGSFVYAPPAGFVGDVSWSYRMSKGSDTFSDWITVTITVTPVVETVVIPDEPTTPVTPVVPVVPVVVPADPPVVPTVDDTLPTLAYTGAGDASTWLLGPALALFGLGGLAVYVARRRAQLS